ncbi:YitT family protein [Geomicrobium sp. JCM 19055]|uniref:YitT family protein n=1 Tax=Geomicrobium sp. JCM 19055 TaxID=1460649 RepID=UPI00187BE6C3|nr:YitT family protein [Geomicrobium sp. JCM 19055]
MRRLLLNLFGCFVLTAGIEVTGLAGLATSGAAGMSLTLMGIIELPFYLLFILVNIPFFILSLIKLGKDYTLNSLYSVIIVSIMTVFSGQWFQMEIPTAIGSVIGGLLVGIGAVLIFLSQSSMGGATILAVYLQKRYRIDPGIVIFCFDTFVAFISFLILGVHQGLLTIVNIFVCSVVISLSKQAIAKKNVEYCQRNLREIVIISREMKKTLVFRGSFSTVYRIGDNKRDTASLILIHSERSL